MAEQDDWTGGVQFGWGFEWLSIGVLLAALHSQQATDHHERLSQHSEPAELGSVSVVRNKIRVEYLCTSFQLCDFKRHFRSLNIK